MKLRQPLFLAPAQAVLSGLMFFLALVVVNGYVLYFCNLPSNPWAILAFTALEGAALVRALHLRIEIRGRLELAGFLFIVGLTWVYLVAPSWPTLLPPTPAGDAANHAAFVNRIYTTGYLFEGYPAGPALLIATLAQWLGQIPLRLIHITGAFFLALTAGGLYSLVCALLPDRREYKTVALAVLWAVLMPWGYFAGMLIGHDYFLTQAAAQLGIVAFVQFLNAERSSNHPLWRIGMSLCLLWIMTSWQLWIVLPLAILGWTLLLDWRSGATTLRRGIETAGWTVGPLALFGLALLATSPELVPARALGHLYTSTGSILEPSVEVLGGVYLILPALGMLLLFRRAYRTSTAAAFLLWALAQTAALFVWHFAFGLSNYFTYKTFYLLVLPLAVAAVLPLAWMVGRLVERGARGFASRYGFLAVSALLAGFVIFLQPAPSQPVMTEEDLQVALWAQGHLNTSNVNLIGRKSLLASWIGHGIWGEVYPSDLFVDWATLGPKTYEEWRDDPAWGDYMFSPSRQQNPPDPTLRVVYQVGDSAILQKPDEPGGDPPAAPALARFGSVLDVQALSISDETLDPGETFTTTLQVRLQGFPSQQVVWRLQLRDRDNRSIAESRADPFDGRFPLQRWPIGKVLTETLSLELPADVEPGLYSLQVGLYYVNTPEAVPVQSANTASADTVRLASVQVPPPTVPRRELVAMTRIRALLGDWVTLLGFKRNPLGTVSPGTSLDVRLYWRCLTAVPRDYHVFVHLLDANNQVRAQQDGPPLDGQYPTSVWDAGQVIADTYTLALPADLAPGTYRIEVGMYEYPSLARLPITDLDHAPLGDHLVLPGEITVVAR